MFGASVAEAASDTCSGELGMLSRQDPVSLLTGRRMPRGLSGAVTPAGLLAGLLSSFVVALCWQSNFFIPSWHAFLLTAIVTVSGFLGSVFDSFLGCTCQACYYDEEHDRLTEHEGVRREIPIGTRLALDGQRYGQFPFEPIFLPLRRSSCVSPRINTFPCRGGYKIDLASSQKNEYITTR